MNVGRNIRRLTALGFVSAACFVVAPGQARADDGPIVDISIPVTLCGVEVGLLGDATGDCPDTPQQGPAIDVDLAPVTSGDITNGGDPAVNVDLPVLVCGNAVAVLTDASATCPDSPPASPDQDATINGNVEVDVCGNAVGVLSPAAGDCGGSSGSSGNDVGLPLGLSDAVPVDSVVDAVGSAVGPGRSVDVQQIVDDLGVGELTALNVEAGICGNGAAVAEDASGACPLTAPGATIPGTTAPGATAPGTTTPGTTGPGATTPGSATTLLGTAPAGGGGLPGTGNGGDDEAGVGAGAGARGGGVLLPTTGGTVLSLLGLGSLLAAAGLVARRAGRARRAVAA